MIKLSPFNPRKISGCALHLDACQGITAVDIPAWVTGTVYAVGTRVVQSATYYKCATAHTSGTFADDLTAVKWVATTDGATQVVSNWADQTTNARHAVQTTAGYRPAYVTNALNGRPVIRFAGTDDYFNITMPALTTFTVFIVAKKTAVTDEASVLLYQTGAGYYMAFQAAVTGIPALFIGGKEANSTNLSNPTSATILGGQRDAGNVMYSSRDGVVTTGQTVADAWTINKIGLYSNAIYNFVGDIAEIIIYPSALTTAQINQVNLYLSRKWNIAVSLIA
jgi:hypothetical protein